MTLKLRALSDSDLLCADAFETTQFYRGRLFIYTDNLLITKFPDPEEARAVKFFTLTLKVIVKWLRRAPELFPCYYRAQGTLLYLEDNLSALAMSSHELLITLSNLFATDHRTDIFFTRYDTTLEGYVPSALTEISVQDYSRTLTFLINVFAKEGGFDAVLQILCSVGEDSRAPFTVLEKLLIYFLAPFCENTFAHEYFERYTQALLGRIELISDEELKSLEYSEIDLLLNKVEEAACGAVEAKRLTLLLKMLRCQYLEKRIKGLSELNKLLEAGVKAHGLRD